MIKFFRRIRQKLLQENRISKYLLYAIGEIVLVVIGILIALQINTWNENNKKREQSTQAILELQTEIKTTREALRKKNEVNVSATRIMKQYLEGQIQNPSDSIKNITVGYSLAYNLIQLSIPIIEREISADHHILEQKTLVKELQHFKDMHFALDQHRFYMDTYWNAHVIPFLKDQKQLLSFVSKANAIDKDVPGLETLYDLEAFKDIVAMEYFFVQGYMQRVERLEEKLSVLDSTLTSIQNEYR